MKQSKVEEICRDDLSITDDYSLYLTEGSATALYYDDVERKIPPEIRGTEWIRKKFSTTAVIDMLILQRMILTVYDAQLDQVTLDAPGLDWLNRIKQDLMLMLEEYQVLGLSHYGSVHETIQRGQEILRIRDMHKLFTQRFEDIERLVQVVESKRRIARDRFWRIVASLITAVLSLTTAHNIVNVICSWTSVPSQVWPSWIRQPFVWIVENFKAHPTRVTLLLYLGILFGTLIAVWWATMINKLRRERKVVPTPEAAKSAARTLAPMRFTVKSIDTVETPDYSSDE